MLGLPAGAHWCLANAKPDSQACTDFAFLAMDMLAKSWIKQITATTAAMVGACPPEHIIDSEDMLDNGDHQRMLFKNPKRAALPGYIKDSNKVLKFIKEAREAGLKLSKDLRAAHTEAG